MPPQLLSESFDRTGLPLERFICTWNIFPFPCVVSIASCLPQKEQAYNGYTYFSFSFLSYSPSFPSQITLHSNRESCLAGDHSLRAFGLFPPQVNDKSYISKRAMFSQQSTEVANLILRHLVKLPLRSVLQPMIYRESAALRTYKKSLLKSLIHFPLCNIHQGTNIQGAACSKASKCYCKLMCTG